MAEAMKMPDRRDEPAQVRVIDRTGSRSVADQVRWGPVLAGVVMTLATLTILSVLALAIGLTATDPGDDAGPAGTIGGIIIALVAFFVGGYTAGKTAAVRGRMSGLFNGAMVWAVALVLSLILTALGAGTVLGQLGGVGVLGDTAQGLTDEAQAGLWWTFIAMAVALAVCAFAGYLGAPRDNTGVGRTVAESA